MKDSDAIWVTCPVAVGTGIFMMKVSKNYEAIVTDLGFTKVAPTAVGATKAKMISVNQAVKNGDVLKITISVKGTATKPSRSTKIVCSVKKVAEALGTLTGKTYGTVITSARPIRKLRYS